jgi:membrane protease YdiL (CAAX protease family)
MFNQNFILFDEARKSKVILNAFFSIILSILMIVVGQIIGQFFLLLLTSSISVSGIFMRPLYLIFSFLFPLLVCFLWVKVIEKRRIRSLGLDSYKLASKFLKGFIIGFIMFSAVTLLMYIFGVIEINQSIVDGIEYIPAIILILPAWILQSSTEEIITRGWLMHIIGARHKPITGFIVSSVLFGLLHIFNPGTTYLSTLNIILVGFLFGLYVIKSQDVWGVCGLHAAWNFAQGNIFGFSVSGGSALSSGSLISFYTRGSDILTGGQFGPEASIFSTVVLLISIIILLLKNR